MAINHYIQMRRFITIFTGLTFVFVGVWSVQGQNAGFGDLAPYFSFDYGDGGGIPADVNNVTGQQTSPDGQTVKLSGNFGPIEGARFGNGFVLYWQGGFQGPMNPGDNFAANLNFGVNVTGGTVQWSFYSDLWSNEGFEDARILTNLTPMPPSGQISGLQLESSSFTQPGETGIFEGYLNLDWTGFSPTDTLSLTIPQNSIDFTYRAVPEPGALQLTLLAFAVLQIWRFIPQFKRSH